MNQRSHRPSVAVVLGALLALTPLSAAAQNSFTVTELALSIGNDPHPVGGYARAINASHQVVGNAYIDRYSVTPTSYIVRPLGVYWDASQSPATLFQETYPDSAFASVAYGINDAGTIAGVETSNQGAASFLYRAGHYLYLESPNNNAFVNALNNSDQSVGVFYNADNTTSAVAWDAAGKAVLPAPARHAPSMIPASSLVKRTHDLATRQPSLSSGTAFWARPYCLSGATSAAALWPSIMPGMWPDTWKPSSFMPPTMPSSGITASAWTFSRRD